MALINDTLRLRDLDRRFLERYDLAGPRYTSYPTAPEWAEEVGSQRVCDHLKAQSDSGDSQQRPLSIYMHIPFCIEHCSFCACNMIASPKMEEISEPYLEMLDQEAALYAQRVDTRRPVIQFHWGGGTPTYLNPDQLRRTHAQVAERFNLIPDAEQSIEVHVTWTSDEQIRTLADLGFNRISLGVQGFHDKTLEAIGRRQTFEQTRHIIDLAREVGFQGINVDLVYGLPYQTADNFGTTVEKVLELAPDRLALYNFAYLPRRLPLQRSIDPATLAAGEEKFKIFLGATDQLTSAGYRYIGMDHFALPGDELARSFDEGTMQRNFMGFTTRAGADLLGMGMTAISSVTNLYAQNVKQLTRYGQALAEGRFPTERGKVLSFDDRLRRDVISQLMCRDHVDKVEIECWHGIDFDQYFATELEWLEPMVLDELLTISSKSLDLTFLGRLFVRNIAMGFDAYLGKSEAGPKPQFSRTL